MNTIKFIEEQILWYDGFVNDIKNKENFEKSDIMNFLNKIKQDKNFVDGIESVVKFGKLNIIDFLEEAAENPRSWYDGFVHTVIKESELKDVFKVLNNLNADYKNVMWQLYDSYTDITLSYPDVPTHDFVLYYDHLLGIELHPFTNKGLKEISQYSREHKNKCLEESIEAYEEARSEIVEMRKKYLAALKI